MQNQKNKVSTNSSKQDTKSTSEKEANRQPANDKNASFRKDSVDQQANRAAPNASKSKQG
ncbi:MAG: hypothetical protein ABIR96_12090 [Bdellovibrionota bacterium]